MPVAKPRAWAQEHLALVSSYGLRWESAETKWPHLLGQRRVGHRKQVVDFTAQMGLYILYQGTRPHYIGIADRLGERIRQHLTDEHEDKWDRFSWFGSKLLPDDTEGPVMSVPYDRPRGAIGVKAKRTWHDFEAVVFHAVGFPSRELDFRAGDGRKRGGNSRLPYFGGDAQQWKQLSMEDELRTLGA